MVLDDNNNIPTQNIKKAMISRLWNSSNTSGKLIDFTIEIINIKITSEHGRVNYKFDELIH